MIEVDKDLEDITKYYNSIPKDIRKNLKIVKADPKFPYMLHGSIDGNIKEFIPRDYERYGNIVLSNIKRIFVSDNIIGCTRAVGDLEYYLKEGYYRNHDFYFYNDADVVDEHDAKLKKDELLKITKKYKGGWYIYAIPYRYCLKNDRDSLYTFINEHWLVDYNSDTSVYHGTIIAKIILKELKYINEGIKKTDIHYTYIIENLLDNTPISNYGNEARFEKGIYEFTIREDRDFKGVSAKDRNNFLKTTKLSLVSYKEISNKYYKEYKNNFFPDF